MKRVNIVVTDLDDTLWDWLRMWHSSFDQYLNRISEEFSVPLDDLKKDFRELHKAHGNSESSYAYRDLKLLTDLQKSKIDDRDSKGMSILHEYYSLKKRNLELYAGVYETLVRLKEHGVLIVAFTESNAFFTKQRFKHLELDGLIDCVYSPMDHGKPESVDRVYSTDYWEPKVTKFRYLPADTLKPAPEILEIILKDFAASKQNAIYIGDKLEKDISMAKKAGVYSVHAAYGSQLDSEKYKLLKEVSHWTDKAIQREAEMKKKNIDTPTPDLVLDNSLVELFKHFEFFPFDKHFFDANMSSIIAIWQKTIDVQQHFNDIELRIRNIALTTFTFIIGAVGYLEKEGYSGDFGDYCLPYSSGLAFIGTLIMFAFFYMDRAWYHKLLLGAVKQGLFIEKRWGYKLPEIKLTQTIGEESPHGLFCGLKVHSKHKYYVFYGPLFFTLLAIGVLLALTANSC